MASTLLMFYLLVLLEHSLLWEMLAFFVGWKWFWFRIVFFVLLLSGSVFFAVYGICLYILKEKFFMEVLLPVKEKFKVLK